MCEPKHGQLGSFDDPLWKCSTVLKKDVYLDISYIPLLMADLKQYVYSDISYIPLLMAEM